MSDTQLQARLFGPPEFRINGEPLPRLKTRKGLYILVLLILRHGREVERNWLAGTLWPENDDATALAYLRQSLTDLRHALGDAANRLVSPTPRTLRLDLEGAETDIDFLAFTYCLKRGGTAALEQAVEIYRGALLEGWAEDWFLTEREDCAQSYLGALEALAQQVREAKEGDYTASIRYLRLIVMADPLRESAYRSLMLALAATRDFGAITQVYRDLRSALRREVNAEPDIETQALFARLRGEAYRQTTPVPAARPGTTSATVAVSRHVENRMISLPHPLSEFIGRVRELEGVRRTLATSRLVTLTGIGGVGKTRLAIRVAEEMADDFPDGIRFADLSPLSDPALVTKTVAGVLGVAEQPRRALTESICEYLGGRQLLLILDNCEHLPDECARFAAALLQGCPNVHILATSRQRLGITGETMRRVPPLALPDLNELAVDEKNAASSLMEFEAVRLFVDRAQRVHPNLHLDAPTLRSIATICNRLDGIPLALELAAARMSALGPEQIAVRLAQRLRLLSSPGSAGGFGDRAAPARQRTLRAVLDWSHDLLTPEEQLLLRRLSVFAGGWTLEAAEAVCAGKGLDEWEVMDCLTGLVEHSLIVVESKSTEVAPRYRLLETVREYGQERLHNVQGTDCEESYWLRAKHREYFIGMAREAAPYLNGLEQARWLDKMEGEHDNLRAALDGCLEEGTTESVLAGLRLAADLLRLWSRRGYAGEGRSRYLALLARDNAGPTLERARALEGVGTLCYKMGDYPPAQEVLEEALTIHRYQEDRQAEVMALNVLGNVEMVLGNYPKARVLLGQALELNRESGDRHGEGANLGAIGNVARFQGNPAEAQILYEQSLAISREVGDIAMEGSILNSLGSLACTQNDFVRALPWLEQSQSLNRKIGDGAQMVYSTFNLAAALNGLGNLAAAEVHFREALILIRQLGEGHSRRMIALLLEAMAVIILKRHSQPERAARLAGASEAQFESIGVRRRPAEQADFDDLLNDLRDALGDSHLHALREEGRTLHTDQAVALALE